MQRHRLIWLYLFAKTDLFNGQPKNMLHIAPERQLSQLFQRTAYLDYLSGDLFDPSAMVRIDVTSIQYPDNAFDVIYCSHVLEHVLDDRKGMREIFRVLKPGGWAILQVPVTAQLTFEDTAVIRPEDRERVFGQYDHVRQYGPDYADRLAEAGFSVRVDGFVRGLGKRTVKRFGLAVDENVYFCRKSRVASSASPP